MTAALEGGEGSASRPGRSLPPGKTRYPLHRRLGGPQERSGRTENLAPTGTKNKVAKRIIRKVPNEELSNLYSSVNIILFD